MSFIKDIFDSITGRGAERAAEESTALQVQAGQDAIVEQRRAAEQGLGFLDPFSAVGEQGLSQAGFLGDPQAQFDFLQNNPLFKLALENANRTTQASAASRGRLNAGDTLTQLSNNVLLSASPLIDRQREDIFKQLNLGQNLAQSQANTALGVGSNVSNLLTDIGATQAGGIIGAQNARQSGLFGDLGGVISGGIGTLAGQGVQSGITALGGFFSDSRLKANAKIINKKNGYNIWEWDWNDKAKKLFNLKGHAIGVMFVDVLKKNPEAVSYQDGYGKVNYSMIGV